MFQFLAHRFNVPVDVRPSGQGLKLAFDRGDFQIGHKGIDDVALLSGAAEKKIDGDDLDQLDVPVVSGVNDAVFHLFNGDIAGDLVQWGGRFVAE